MSTEKRLLKVKKLIKASEEPLTDAFNYKSSIVRVFNYHNTYTDVSDIRAWAIEYAGSIGVELPSVREIEFKTLGVLARLKTLDAYLEPEDEEKIQLEIDRIFSLKAEAVIEIDDSKPSRSDSIERTTQLKTSEFIGEFEGMIDEFFTTGTAQNIQGLITSMGVSSRVAPKVQEYAKKRADYYRSVVDDKEAMEYYSFSKSTLKKAAGMYDDLIEKLSQNKKVRAPQKRKEKPAGLLVKDLKFKISDEETGLKSVPASTIIGATELYLFRTDTRKLQYFKSVEGSTLTVKGTTILNYDESKSFQKTIRKPEILKEIQSKGKLDSRRFVKEIKSTEAKVSGRTNEDTIILNVLK